MEFNTFRTHGDIKSVGCDHNTCTGVDRVDPSPRDHNQSTCMKWHLIDCDRELTCQHVDTMEASDLHRKGESKRQIGRLTWWWVETSGPPDHRQTRNREVAVRPSSEGGSDIKGDRGPRSRSVIAARSWTDRYGIVAWSPRDRGLISTQPWPWSLWIDGARSSCDRGHQFHLSPDQTAWDFWAKSPLKTDELSLL